MRHGREKELSVPLEHVAGAHQDSDHSRYWNERQCATRLELRAPGFFIEAALGAGGKTRTDNTDDVVFPGVRYDE